MKDDVDFAEVERKRKHLEAILVNDPSLAGAHLILARLLISHYADYIGARKHLESAIEITQDDKAHFDLAILLLNHFSEPSKAKEHLKKAIHINVENVPAHYYYAILLARLLSDYDRAKKHLE